MSEKELKDSEGALKVIGSVKLSFDDLGIYLDAASVEIGKYLETGYCGDFPGAGPGNIVYGEDVLAKINEFGEGKRLSYVRIEDGKIHASEGAMAHSVTTIDPDLKTVTKVFVVTPEDYEGAGFFITTPEGIDGVVRDMIRDWGNDYFGNGCNKRTTTLGGSINGHDWDVLCKKPELIDMSQ
jgi:hypothetical protein